MCEPPPLWPDRRDFFKDELSRLRTAKVAKVTRSVPFSLKCTRNRLRPDPLDELERSHRPPSRIRGQGPPGRDGRWVGEGKEEGGEGKGGVGWVAPPLCEILNTPLSVGYQWLTVTSV